MSKVHKGFIKRDDEAVELQEINKQLNRDIYAIIMEPQKVSGMVARTKYVLRYSLDKALLFGDSISVHEKGVNSSLKTNKNKKLR
jgi:hypothetical protein